MWIRHVLVPGITTDDADLEKLRDFVGSLKTVERFEILPYHTLGVFKWENLMNSYELGDVMPPTKEEIAHAEEILHTADYKDYSKIKCRINAGWIKIDRIKSIKKTGIYVKSISVSDMYACFVICNSKN